MIANLARHYSTAGDSAKARAYLRRALELQERGDFREARAYTLAMLGYLSEREGDLTAAAEWTSEAIAVAGELQKDELLAYALVFAADLVQRRGDDRSGRTRLLGASTAAFARATVVPQDEEAARAVRMRDGLSEYAAGREEKSAELDSDRSVELGVTSLAIAQRTRSK